MLDKQIQLYMMDTGHLYSNNERRLHNKNAKKRMNRRFLLEVMKKIETIFEQELNITPTTLATMVKEYNFSDIEHLFDNYSKEEFILKKNNRHNKSHARVNKYTYGELLDKYIRLTNANVKDREAAKIYKEKLLSLLNNKMQANIQSKGRHHIRTVRENDLKDSDKIATFESTLTRVINAETDKLTDEIFSLQIYYYEIFHDAMTFGVDWKGERYRYLTSSAGMIRKKRGVFIKESTWDKVGLTLLGGLTTDKINECGGVNINKYLSYLSLTNSATDPWYEFDIDKTIVIDDFETKVHGEAEFIDDTDYSITRKVDDYLVSHTDGAGMVLPSCLEKNVMFRAPWIKGLLGVFNFREFIDEYDCSPIIKDIWGKEHDVIKEDIQIIFTKSQFKMWKYYDSWEDYKEKFKKYNCEAGLTNEEESHIKNATINYQMLQQTVDFTEEELDEFIKPSVNKLKNMCGSYDGILNAMGINRHREDLNPFQKSMLIYPPLIHDSYTKDVLRDLKDSLIKRYRAGKIDVKGKYTFVLPDFFAACEYWFQGIENPNGLLTEANEIYCELFPHSKELVCLRSPSLYHETPVRKNLAWVDNFEDSDEYCNQEGLDWLHKWFGTKAIYTSTHDLITRILQLDVDGDHLLLVSDKPYIEMCKKNMNDVVSLYYDAKQAKPVILNPENMWTSLNIAFSNGKIGLYSNSISKIWNSEVFSSGTIEEKQEALDTIKRLCMESNFSIDCAKTLYFPERQKFFEPIVAKYTNVKLPAFFEYAKDKKPHQVQERNKSFVNMIYDKIPNIRLDFRGIKGVDKFNHKMLMSDSVTDIPDEVIALYEENNSLYKYKINQKDEYNPNLRFIALEVRQKFNDIGYSDIDVTNMLVKHIYGKKLRNKQLLWFCYGEYIYENILNNLKLEGKPMRTIQCIDCGEYFDVPNTLNSHRTCRCNMCQKEYRKYWDRNRKKALK